MTKKFCSLTKTYLNISREQKELLRWNKKHFASIQKGFQSSKQIWNNTIFLEDESPHEFNGLVARYFGIAIMNTFCAPNRHKTYYISIVCYSIFVIAAHMENSWTINTTTNEPKIKIAG